MVECLLPPAPSKDVTAVNRIDPPPVKGVARLCCGSATAKEPFPSLFAVRSLAFGKPELGGRAVSGFWRFFFFSLRTWIFFLLFWGSKPFQIRGLVNTGTPSLLRMEGDCLHRNPLPFRMERGLPFGYIISFSPPIGRRQKKKEKEHRRRACCGGGKPGMACIFVILHHRGWADLSTLLTAGSIQPPSSKMPSRQNVCRCGTPRCIANCRTLKKPPPLVSALHITHARTGFGGSSKERGDCSIREPVPCYTERISP